MNTTRHFLASHLKGCGVAFVVMQLEAIRTPANSAELSVTVSDMQPCPKCLKGSLFNDGEDMRCISCAYSAPNEADIEWAMTHHPPGPRSKLRDRKPFIEEPRRLWGRKE